MSLPAPDETNTLREDSYTAPRTEMEKTVAGILEHLLKLEHVDVEENFFSLGGHSLLGHNSLPGCATLSELRCLCGLSLRPQQ